MVGLLIVVGKYKQGTLKGTGVAAFREGLKNYPGDFEVGSKVRVMNVDIIGLDYTLMEDGMLSSGKDTPETPEALIQNRDWEIMPNV